MLIKIFIIDQAMNYFSYDYDKILLLINSSKLLSLRDKKNYGKMVIKIFND